MQWIYTNLRYPDLDIDLFKFNNKLKPKIASDEMEIYYDQSLHRDFKISCVNLVYRITWVSYLGLKNGDIVPPDFNHIDSRSGS